MILKTIEFIPADITLTIDKLREDVYSGKYNDILQHFCFLTFTEKGLTLVNTDKSIITNATVDLSEYIKSDTVKTQYVEKKDGHSLIDDNEIERLSKIANYDDSDIKKNINELSKNVTDNYAKIADIPDVSNFITETHLNNYAKLNDIPDVSDFINKDILAEYVKKSDTPSFSFLDDGTLSVTINGVTNLYAPIAAN